MKKELRKKYLYIRKNISNKSLLDKIIYEKIIYDEFIKKSDVILIYVSKSDEVDTLNLIKYFLSIKKLVAVPKVKDASMEFYYINSLKDLKLGTYNILEPITDTKVTNFSNAVCLTPGICFSKDLYRLGYGGGYYDRFFQKHSVYSIGLCYSSCLLDNLPIEKHDQKLQKIVTDDNCYF